jgi:hypothetical protein
VQDAGTGLRRMRCELCVKGLRYRRVDTVPLMILSENSVLKNDELYCVKHLASRSRKVFAMKVADHRLFSQGIQSGTGQSLAQYVIIINGCYGLHYERLFGLQLR